MVRFYLFLFCGIIFLTQSCAEIIPLTGGEKDTIAPKVVEGKQNPEQASTYFNGNEFSITFDEYVVLNDPNSTVSLNPSAGKLTTSLDRKTVRVQWADSLKPNTTYSLQFNGTVRDLNESNDSIMQFVFSTGGFIDSLAIKGLVINSFNDQIISQVTVGLYAIDKEPSTDKPIYATRTNGKGEFSLNYLTENRFKLIAFKDENKDQLAQVSEQIGFSDSIVSTKDTSRFILKLFPEKAILNQLRVKLLPPNLAAVYGRDSIKSASVYINGTIAQLVETVRPDSLVFGLPMESTANYIFVYDGDTVVKPLSKTERLAPFQISNSLNTKTWKVGNSIYFSVNDVIQEIDTSKIRLINDKGVNESFGIQQSDLPNRFVIVPNSTILSDFRLRFEQKAIVGKTTSSDSISYSFTTRKAEDLSNLTVNMASFSGFWLVELIQNEKVIYSEYKNSSDTTVLFTHIEPGMYVARCIEDLNGNRLWDTGNYEKGLQPERVFRYTLTQKLRANWDVEETLVNE